MINEHYVDMLKERSVIRAISERAAARRAEVGEQHVFDFSIGNPSVPTTHDFTEAMIDLYETESPIALHGYSPSTGLPVFTQAVADSLNRRFGMDYEPSHIYPTSGATAALAHAFRAVTKPGDEMITFAPYFPEYRPYSEAAGLTLTVLPCDPKDFQIDFAALEQAMNPNVQAILINTPNNPSGAVYSAATLQRLADLMRAKQEEYGHAIFLISDEPYREITFDGAEQPYPSKFYDNTLSCYSFSKSLSLPGERIGYVAVNPKAEQADIFGPMFTQISRCTGHNCPGASIQRAVARVIDETADLAVYGKNMELLYDTLIELGFEVVRPGGTFYMFPKALEDDANAFCEKAMHYDLFMVPSDSFGMPGYVRMSFCLDTSKVEAAIPALRRFVTEVYGR
ncbi:pyridoxal phosphate-dependent aminotransferase [Bifidobacterium gallicum]|uniref:Aminotransferase n=1 Tax=Bifidobacterium gallicum DSM 20093 = LMG 11596 TaxID=561180 RepID=D1NUG7_9BIFI|nr:pyridoxal phosphate-dependent aminotransferase [Bifidobacterium gallicum]EFA23371.1 aminotransferase, class I/II [Bifidobacterium gallicum DSM 20093 = LMG 11596]KFI57873.1 aspartate aminotransferase [Bifidobacterium gallicum DSM 20093 = LMG 11596]